MDIRIVARCVFATLLLGFGAVASAPGVAQVPVPETYSAAMRWYFKAANDGDANAQFLLGLKYERGVDLPADSAKAVRWYGKAAKQGHAEAQFMLASLYARGDGVPTDMPQSVDLYRKAAVQGLSAAQYNLGVAYLNGSGISPNPELALAWVSIAAEAGLAPAVALYQELRETLPTDLVEAAGKRATVLRRDNGF